MIDTHAHIDMECYEARLNEVFTNAKEAGVEKIILPGVNSESFDKIITLIEKYDFLYGALGVHPSELDSFNDAAKNKMIELAKHDKIVAIGEIGLDYYWDKETAETQKKVFRSQIEIAHEVSKPLLIHDRDAHEDSLNILKEMDADKLGVVMHCFSGSVEFAQQCLKEGYYLALGGVTTFKNAKKAKEVAKMVPLDKLLLETDSPYLTPTPHRGEENEPAYVRFVAQEIADLRGISLEEVDKQTTLNANNLFNFTGSKNV